MLARLEAVQHQCDEMQKNRADLEQLNSQWAAKNVELLDQLQLLQVLYHPASVCILTSEASATTEIQFEIVYWYPLFTAH